MVSFWPWKGDSSSPASFEKTLSALSSKITDTQSRLDRMYSSSRRIKVLWTLYLGFAYLVYAIVELLVIGYQNIGVYEWTGMAGGPVFIYVTRTIISAYFNFRIENLSARLKKDQEERTKTIQKLKDATKYDSTMELIEKYGGAENKPKSKKKDKTSSEGADKKSGASSSSPAPKGGVPARTNLPPPPTANIVRSSPRPSLGNQPDNQQSMRQASSPVGMDNVQSGAEFAPNAFSHPSAQTLPPSARGQNQYMGSEHHWYDRIFDVLLGEDETAAKNRFVLICQNCRRVNGQAPPGTKSLAELGLWKCMTCSAVNGEKDEGERIVQEVLAGSSSKDTDHEGSIVSAGEAEAEVSEEDEHDGEAGSDGNASDVKTTGAEGPAGSVKARRRTGKK